MSQLRQRVSWAGMCKHRDLVLFRGSRFARRGDGGLALMEDPRGHRPPQPPESTRSEKENVAENRSDQYIATEELVYF